MLVLLLAQALASSGHSFVTFSFLDSIHTYLMTRAFGAFSNLYSRLANKLNGMVACSVITDAIIMSWMLSLIFKAKNTATFWGTAVMMCTSSLSYSMSYSMPSPTSLSARLVIAKVSWSSLDSRCFQCTCSTSLGIPFTPNPNTYLLTTP